MPDDRPPNVIEMPRPPVQAETLTVTITLAGAGDQYPKVTMQTDGKRSPTEISPVEMGSAFAFTLVSLGNSAKQWGEQDVPAAVAIIYRSGRVLCTAEASDFVAPARKRWLDRCLDVAKAEFASIFASAESMKNAEHGDGGGGGR